MAATSGKSAAARLTAKHGLYRPLPSPRLQQFFKKETKLTNQHT